MVQVKDLTELSLRELWTEVKEEEEWWGDLKQETLRLVKRLLEGAMEGEIVEQLGAGRYRRTSVRRGYRNGYRHRSLLTKLGLVEHLRVPRDRDGQYRPTVLPRYQRRQEKVIEKVLPFVNNGGPYGIRTGRRGQSLASTGIATWGAYLARWAWEPK